MKRKLQRKQITKHKKQFIYAFFSYIYINIYIHTYIYIYMRVYINKYIYTDIKLMQNHVLNVVYLHENCFRRNRVCKTENCKKYERKQKRNYCKLKL